MYHYIMLYIIIYISICYVVENERDDIWVRKEEDKNQKGKEDLSDKKKRKCGKKKKCEKEEEKEKKKNKEEKEEKKTKEGIRDSSSPPYHHHLHKLYLNFNFFIISLD